MSLTPHENLLRLWRREGFEDSPAFFNLCPSLIEEFKRRYGCAQSYQDQFNIPFRGVSTIAKDNKHDWMKYYPGVTFNPGTTFDNCGVANEPQPESIFGSDPARTRHSTTNHIGRKLICAGKT